MTPRVRKRAEPSVLLDRIAGKFDVDPATDCWVWTASLDVHGYGRQWDGQRAARAHRLMHELAVGPIPDGLHIDHLCRNPPCVNPDHLEPVPPGVNTKRGNAPNIIAHRTNRCRRGHEFNDENTYVTANGTRCCRACARITRRIRNSSRSPNERADSTNEQATAPLQRPVA